MDRNKSLGSSRSSKGKHTLPHHGSELYALGSKASSSRDDSKSKVMSSSKGVSDRKRETSSSLSSISSKKPKLSAAIPTTKSTDTPTGSNTIDYWEQVALECEPVDLVSSVLSAIEQQDSDTVVGLICGAIKALISPRLKPDSILTLSLLYLAKVRPHLFCNETITSGLISILKRDSQHTFKGRNNPTIHILATNLLARGYHDKKQWPETFVRVYIDDAINERVWVDYDDCASFIENICTAFGTKTPPKSMLQPELNALNPTSRDGLSLDEESSESLSSDVIKTGDINLDCAVQPRYTHIASNIEKLVLDAIKEQFNRRQPPDCSTRNFLRFLSATSGLCEVRAMAITRLELWIHNGKLMKPAQELLTYICYNVTGQTVRDQEVLANLVKMRLKTKPLINIYMTCLKEMINLQPEILFIVLKFVVQNELSNARNPNNMGMLANMFQTKPDASAKHLAEIYQEFLLQREDCLRTLRVFLRELVKMLRYDINLMIFCKAFITIRTDLTHQIQNFEFKDRVFLSMADLICLCMFLSVSPQIREANASLRTGKDIKCSTVLQNFYCQMSTIQMEALTWIHEIVPILFRPFAADYSQCLHKILLLDAPEQYSKGDQWPPEPERAVLLRLVSEIPVHQDSLLRIILIGITKEIPFSVPDTMEIIEKVVKRAAGLRIADYPPLEANKLEIIDFLFSMAEYHHPDKIVLPVGYEPPKLAISALYWKAWNILLMLSAHNPSTFGSFCWEQYPMLRTFMELCITNQFNELKAPEEELQISALEKTQILEFESHLAAATSKVVITEQNSLLLSQLMLMDPLGVSRKPPTIVLEQLQGLNFTHRLGHLLCRSRKPDLLLDIITRYGTSQSMPWLADLVQNSDGDFNHLPVQCLCEFLLSNSNNMDIEKRRNVDLLVYLQNLLKEKTGDHQASCEVLEYFLRRLSSTSKLSRQLAINGLKLLLKVFEKKYEGCETEISVSDWLLQHLPQMPHFHYVRPIVIIQLRAACQIENNPDLIMIYIQFIAAHTLHDPVPDMLEHVMDMSQLIVERSTVFSYITPSAQDPNENKLQTLNCLFVMFNNYVIKLRDEKPPHTWPEYPDLLMVHFSDGTQLPIHLNIIQAFVILMTYSSLLQNALPILDYWFPINGTPPQAFHIETSDPVQLLPDWLKLKMIRSSVDRLVDAALQNLSPDQIVLFLQNFGTPINSMSKLLALLDRAVIEQFDVVKAAILHKAYLAQLIEIQQARGAKNGHIAVQALELHSQTTTDQPIADITIIEPVTSLLEDETSPTATSVNSSKSKEIEEITEIVFTQPQLNKNERTRFRKLAQQLIATDIRGVKLSPKAYSIYSSANQTQEYTASKLLHYLHKISSSNRGIYLIQNLTERSSVVSLFRSLLTWAPEKSENNNYLVQVLDKCIKQLKLPTNSVLLQILLNKRKSFVKVQKEVDKVETQDLIQVLQTAKITEVERNGIRLLNGLLKRTNSGYLVEAILSVLRASDALVKEEIISDMHNLKSDKKGLLVDWLADADSELISSNQELQMDLLFSSSLRQFRFYMLSLLSHQTSWATLQATVNKLLEKYNPNYDASSVLDFIGALINNPKLWQGRDKTAREQVEYILQLDEHQIETFIEYIIKENVPTGNVLTTVIQKDDNKLCSRVNLLLQCVNPESFNLKKMIQYVDQHKSDKVLKERLLQQLYLNMPPIKFLVHDLNNVYDANVTSLTGCSADKVCHFILTAIASLQSPKDWQMMSQDMELLVRKMAASHPSLLLRQLTELAALLQGRAHMDLQVLRIDYHLPLFNQVLGILELLQPQIYQDAYKDGLHAALDCYIALLRNHGNTKDVLSIMYRFVDFMQAYITANATRALKFIEPHTELLQELAANNRNIVNLHQLVQGVSLLKHKTENITISSSKTDDKPSTSLSTINASDTDSQSAAAIILAPYSKPNPYPPHWPSLISVIQKGTSEDILPTLQEIENLTAKRIGILDDLYEKILELLFSPSANIRAIAHVLLARHLRHNPGNPIKNSTALTAYIHCLESDDLLIAQSALDSLTDIVICLQEYAKEILQTVFNLGISSNINTYNHLRKCILALKTQHAC